MHLVNGEFLQVPESREELLILRERPRIPAISTRDGQCSRAEGTKLKYNA
jgi:hypothetical protein